MGVFGQEGEGPGEFDGADLVRGEDGTVGVHDPGLGRFTVFGPSGDYLSEVLVPISMFEPLRSFGPILSGVSVDIMAMLAGGTAGSLMTRYDVNLATGEAVREEVSPEGPWDIACGKVTWGIPDRAGGWVFVACEGHLIFEDDTGDATVVRAPACLAELPDERDVARHEEMLRSVVAGRPVSQSVDEELEVVLVPSTSSARPAFGHDDLAGPGTLGQPSDGDTEETFDIKRRTRWNRHATPHELGRFALVAGTVNFAGFDPHDGASVVRDQHRLAAPNLAQQSTESVLRLAHTSPFHIAIMAIWMLAIKRVAGNEVASGSLSG